jgi:hypothetical protein
MADKRIALSHSVLFSDPPLAQEAGRYIGTCRHVWEGRGEEVRHPIRIGLAAPVCAA